MNNDSSEQARYEGLLFSNLGLSKALKDNFHQKLDQLHQEEHKSLFPPDCFTRFTKMFILHSKKKLLEFLNCIKINPLLLYSCLFQCFLCSKLALTGAFITSRQSHTSFLFAVFTVFYTNKKCGTVQSTSQTSEKEEGKCC